MGMDGCCGAGRGWRGAREGSERPEGKVSQAEGRAGDAVCKGGKGGEGMRWAGRGFLAMEGRCLTLSSKVLTGIGRGQHDPIWSFL